MVSRFKIKLWLACILTTLGSDQLSAQSFIDKSANPNSLPQVPKGFVVTEFAREPLVRQPCSMAFDEQGRLFVGMGPQYRNPTPDTPGDSVVMVADTDGDGVADRTQAFATGFNAIQGLAWYGRELWIANAPDLTVVRDLDGDDVADEYVRLYTDLGNLEHGLHGLVWAPDGMLYMSKGNSKGLSQPGRYAPKPFRDLWGVSVPQGVPDYPAPQVFTKETYQRTYHDPEDDWGLDGGVLRCDSAGNQLQIVSRGMRNPWDIAVDGGFNWLGTDNDQTQGDRVLMPFFGAHFGWNHSWSSHWTTESHLPTAPVSGPLFEGSGTGIVYGDSPQFPSEYRGVFFINDWLQKTTYVWRPEWDGALMKPASGDWLPFVSGSEALFRPTDLEFGPDGALWILGWSSGYGAEWQDGELTNEGRIYRIAWQDGPELSQQPMAKSVKESTVSELIQDFTSTLPVRRINAQNELLRRGVEVQKPLLDMLKREALPEATETWVVWTLQRLQASVIGDAAAADEFYLAVLRNDFPASLNLRVQCVRILAERCQHPLANSAVREQMQAALRQALRDNQPRVRFAAVQAIHIAKHKTFVPELFELIEQENDTTIQYASWQALKSLVSQADLFALLEDEREAVRRAALLGLLEVHAVTVPQVKTILEREARNSVAAVASLWLEKMSGGIEQIVRGKPLSQDSQEVLSNDQRQRPLVLRNIDSKGKAGYRAISQGMRPGGAVYFDRNYVLKEMSPELVGFDLIQTANDDDNSSGTNFLSAEALMPLRLMVGVDKRLQIRPRWLEENFQPTEFVARLNEGAEFRFYEASFPTGKFVLGGNTEDGVAGGKGNYFVIAAPLPLPTRAEKTTLEQVAPLLGHADPYRGRLLFEHPQGAGCAKCHSLDSSPNGFGPPLGNIGMRSSANHIMQSIIEPSAVITEGFNRVNVLTESGQIISGVLLEESGLTLSLGLTSGERVDIPKSLVEERTTSHTSAMPDMAELLSPQQVADLTAFLLTRTVAEPNATYSQEDHHFKVQTAEGRLLISLDDQAVTEFVYADNDIHRPYFANVRLANGLQVTRNHPPVEGLDATDHATMHPGIWLGMGDINGVDFWRNKGRMQHRRFVVEPEVSAGQLTFATECQLLDEQRQPIGQVTHWFKLLARPCGWLVTWHAQFEASERELVFGDQEEMGFGARLATALTEKSGGRILNSKGLLSARDTWGQAATWCDYSGRLDDQMVGVTLFASPNNFRESWWHNRDYGVFVANPFGREAMKQGERSAWIVPQGEEFTIAFAALVHSGEDIDFANEYALFAATLETDESLQPNRDSVEE
jgi:putative membrane-bound dehydrogenase-like protein